VDVPATRYTKSVDGVHVAYQVCGSGPLDLVLVNSAYSSNMEIGWEWDAVADGFRWLARILQYDAEGRGWQSVRRFERVERVRMRASDPWRRR
jgi:hypothetical protein